MNIKAKYIGSILLFFMAFTAFGQGKFTVVYSSDTIVLDQAIKVEYIIENLEGNYTPPSFEGFTIASGPNVTSSFSMINGDVSQSKKYTYLLIPGATGDIEIGAATLQNGDNQYTTQKIKIYVLDRNSTYKKPIKSLSPQAATTTKPTKKRVLRKI